MIDIVIPAHAGGRYFESAVRSVLAQTSPDWRLHVLDDASPGSAIHDFVSELEDSRISYRRNERNQGINAQFNRALATGDASHLVIMGEDDEMLPSYVARALETLSGFPEAAVLQPGVEVIDAAGDAIRPLGDRVKSWLALSPDAATPYCGEDLLVSLLRGNWCYFPSLCWSRAAVGDLRFSTDFDVVQDLALLVEVIRRGGSLVVDPTPTFRYRRHRASLSSKLAVDGRRFKEEGAYFQAAARSLRQTGQTRAARAARLHLTSRLHALTRIPSAARGGDPDAVRLLIRHTTR